MRLIKLAAPLLALLLAAPAALAQQAPKAAPEPIRFGQIDPKDLTAAPFAADSAAAAVVLCDYGTTRFEGHGAGLRLVFERTTRIKILKKAGYEYATVQVPLYHKDENSEELGRLRGFTYNLDESGKVRKTALADANTFSEELTKNVRVRKFTLPGVRPGSVIEYSYIVRSDFLFNLQDWTFQRDIPTRWSEYRTTIPGFYRYKIIRQTNRPFTAFDERVVMVNLSVDNRVAEGNLSSGQTAGSMHVTAAAIESRWVMKDLPAFQAETFMTTADDYVVRVNFELAGEQWSESEPFRDMSQTWPKINAKLLEADNFGRQLGRADFMKEPMQALAAQHPDPTQRAAAVRTAVMQAIGYDGQNRYSTDSSPKKAFDAHRGTSADVNLLLIAALRHAGLPAQPVLLSTRDHGRVSRDFPLLEKFNYVVALVPLAEGKEMLVDATEPLLPCGTLPERCLNRTGRLIEAAPAEGRWIDLTPAQRYVYFQQTQLTLAPDGNLSGQVHEERGGYAGAEARAELGQLGEKKYLAARTEALSSGTVTTASIKGQQDIDKPLQVDYRFTEPAENSSTAPVDQLYLSPFATLGTDKNPFTHTDRQFPVDFGTSREDTRLLTLTLPQGYELAELPKSLIVNLPEEGGRYTFGVVNNGSIVQLSSRLVLRKPVYSAAEYVHLRDMYRLMLSKQSEKLIIKKKV